jgi:hypothetical protein
MDIYAKIKSGDYDSIERVKALKFTCACGRHYYERSIPNFCFDCGAPVKKAFDVLKDEYTVQLEVTDLKNAQISRQFMKDALEYCKLTGHPKAEQAFSLAQYHCDGRNDLVELLEQLAELML